MRRSFLFVLALLGCHHTTEQPLSPPSYTYNDPWKAVPAKESPCGVGALTSQSLGLPAAKLRTFSSTTPPISEQSGAAPSSLLAGVYTEGPFIKDGDWLYWFTPYAGIEQPPNYQVVAEYFLLSTNLKTKESIVLAASAHPGHLVSDSRCLYWTQSWDLTAISKQGGAVLTIPKAANGDLVADKDGIYWSHYSNEGATYLYALYQGSDTPLLLSRDSERYSTSSGITTDDESVYFLSRSVQRFPKKGGTPKELTHEAYSSETLTNDQEALYWAGGGQLYRLPKSGGNPTIIVEEQSNIISLTIKDGLLYWVETKAPEAKSLLWRASKDGKGFVVVAQASDPFIQLQSEEGLYLRSNEGFWSLGE